MLKWIDIPKIVHWFLLIFLVSCSEQETTIHYPLSEQIIQRKSYTLSYDMQHRQSRWTYEHLTPEKIQGDFKNRQFSFMEDPLVPQNFRSTNADFAGSHFDRGHLCPAADARLSKECMQETFYLSNISPQSPQFNRGYWTQLEKHVRDLTQKYEELHVFTGPLYLSQLEADGKHYVKYQVIGKNTVAVPTHFYKILYDKHWAFIDAYILPNAPIKTGTALADFSTTIEKIERAAGLIFYKK